MGLPVFNYCYQIKSKNSASKKIIISDCFYRKINKNPAIIVYSS